MNPDPPETTPEISSEMAPEPSTPPPSAPSTSISAPLLRPRREVFDHGLLPVPKFSLPDPLTLLSPLKPKLSEGCSPSHRINAASLADFLQISTETSSLILQTLAGVLHCEDKDLGVDGEGTADFRDVLLFLYVQGYKRLVPRANKDSPVVNEVWPHASAFDGYLSALSPIQLVRSNSRKFVPSQSDEEAHQLSYLQKHIANILSLLSDTLEGVEGDDALVITQDTFGHLGFLMQFSEGLSITQASPFFANSDPDMPAAPIPASQIHEWISQQITASLEYATEKEKGPSPLKEASVPNVSGGNADTDITMVDAPPTNSGAGSNNSRGQLNNGSNPTYYRNQTFVEGFSKASVVKHPGDIKGHSIKVLNCHDSMIYILAPVSYATVYGCSDATIVLGAVGKAVKIEHCERVQIVAATKRICIANCRECIFYLGVNQKPLIVGDNHKLQVAPFNTYYAQLGQHLAQSGINPNENKWDQPFVLGMVDPHDALSHPAGVSDAQSESSTCLDPDLFTNFLIPSWFCPEVSEPTIMNPFVLPEAYREAQKKKEVNLAGTEQTIRSLQLDENKKRDLACALHAQFKDWLYSSGNIRQLYCLQAD
ncbi:C-CAP/cofactor C-like domain-containing protein [Rhynchospora pubera]|uniref:TBCC domain-containing protein 1 n=1 Tax=Rhynchospora pubera TaxID=906938 RepID=A0AAV8BXR9_9POAL|nr:C-CAP/cofactor C-like domain-containing protein [Rhynchospora pubera]